MRGAERLCRDGRILLIYAELVVSDTYHDQPTFPAMLDAYYTNNFVLYNIYNIKLDRMGAVQYMDAIFCYRPWIDAMC